MPMNFFKGEVFCSRYGLFIDAHANPQGHRSLFDILYLIDGQHSVEDIAAICKIQASNVEGVLIELARHGLVQWEAGSTQS